jgi:uncharacterized protein
MLKKVLITLAAIFTLWLLASLILTSQATAIIFNNQISWGQTSYTNYYKQSFLKTSKDQNFSLLTYTKPEALNHVLYLHGNAGRLPNFMPELVKFSSVYSPAYPGYSESEGSPTPENVYDVALKTYDKMVADGIAEENIVIFGHSMGGSPAVYLASQKPKAKKLVLANTFSSVQSMCFKSYSILCGFSGGIFNSAENAKKVTIPVAQFAYKGDTTVPFEEGKKLFGYFPNKDKKTFVEMDKHTHTYLDWDLVSKELSI